ncbi:DNRLRE domain-containing protein [Streptacidiphilus sp. MAP12-20]|uniref:DNRLRE domain-containing protein n=1 Tax=Streptacidiphilus sp. MAP12-20 TaxID=3156299 RepID=UPI0035136DEB
MAGLSWWQAVLVLAPLPLIGMGGAVGGFVGGTAAAANGALARRTQFGAGITALAMSTVSLFAYGLYFILAGALLSVFTSSQQTSAPLGGPIVATTAASPAPYRTPPPVPQWKAVPAGVVANQPSVINATGAALTWSAYVNTTGDAPYDVARYEVYRSTPNQDLAQSPGELVGTVRSDRTSFVDTGAPARTGPHDGIYNYLIGVRTRAGKLIQGPPLLVQLPMPGRTELAIQAAAADTIASGQPNAVANTVLAQRSSKQLEIGPDEDLGLGITRLVFGFGPLAALPRGAAVVEAHLSVWRTSGGNYPDQCTLYTLSRSFTGAHVTWNRASAGTTWARPGGDYTAPSGRVSAFDPSNGRSDFDATAAVRDWIRDPGSEHGLLLKADTESVRTAPLLNGFYVSIGGSYPAYPASESPELYLTYTGASPTVAATATTSP